MTVQEPSPSIRVPMKRSLPSPRPTGANGLTGAPDAGEHIDFAAPGVAVWTAASVSGARPKTGTSFAAPFVTAAVAMMKASEPELAAEMLRDRLTGHAEDLGDPGKDPVFGWGLLNARAICKTKS